MNIRRTQVLILADYFLPGYKAGGPIRSLAGICEVLGDEFAFKIVTRDRDLGSKEPYLTIRVNQWQRVGKVDVYYVSPARINLFHLGRLINSTEHDILYLQSYLSPGFTILPLLLRRAGLIRLAPTIVAPRGEFSEGALRIKRVKKKIYFFISRLCGLYQGVVWQASSIYEKKDIEEHIHAVLVSIASNVVQIASDISPNAKIPQRLTIKKAGFLKVMFLSRISRMKNLDGALEMLRNLKGDVTFNIYGPLEDSSYWDICQGIIETMPRNICVSYHGVIAHDKVGSLFAEHDLFLLPTHGENFGHAILEALSCGCPILISDNTPWRNLTEAGVGWDLSLSSPGQFTAIMQDCVAMDSERWLQLSENAKSFSAKSSMISDALFQNRQLFLNALHRIK